MKTAMAASWVRMGWATAGMAVLVPLVALWSTLPDVAGGSTARRIQADGADTADLTAVARALNTNLRDAVQCVGDAGAAMAVQQEAKRDQARSTLDRGLEDCFKRGRGLAAIHVIPANGPSQSANSPALAGEEALALPWPGLVESVQRAIETGRVGLLPLPDAQAGRSNGVVQVVPLDVTPPLVVLLVHRLTAGRITDLPGDARAVAHPALLVDARPDARGVPVPRHSGLRLVGDGDSWLPEWARDARGSAWLFTALTVALLAGALVTQRALERHDRFRYDIERSVPVGLRAVDLEGRIVWANQAFVDMVGWPASKIIGSREPFVFWEETARSERQDQWDAIIRGQIPGDTYTATFVHQNGRRFQVRGTVNPMKGRNGWMLASTDITAENEMAGRIANLLNTLGQLNLRHEIVRQMELKLHHHHSTALGVVNWCRALVEGMAEEQFKQPLQLAERALNAAMVCEREASELLKATEPERPQPVNLWEAVMDSFAMAEPAIRDSNTHFLNTVSKDLPRVMVPRVPLLMILVNLIQNGVRAMGSQGIAQRELSIYSDHAHTTDCIRILVRDRGCGIPRDQWEKVFEPDQPSAAGNGLGLHRSRELVRAWGGEIEVGDSHTNGVVQDTVMVLTVPLKMIHLETDHARRT